MYYTVTTITTVGYGDISAYNPAERCLAILVMIVGVIAFSYATGSLSSLIVDQDHKEAEFQNKLETLEKIN